jgi:hypothetical protein
MLPLGGRLLALRTILEAPESMLSRIALLERQHFLVSFPAYRELAEAGAAMQEALRATSVVAKDPDDIKSLAAQFDAWAANTEQRQHLLMQLAPRRLPSSIEFPPLRTTAELQKSLDEGVPRRGRRLARISGDTNRRSRLARRRRAAAAFRHRRFLAGVGQLQREPHDSGQRACQ